MPKQYTQIPPKSQATRYSPFPVYSDEETAQLRALAREQYGLTGDQVVRFVRLNQLLDHYSNIVDRYGSLNSGEQMRQALALRYYETLTRRHARLAA